MQVAGDEVPGADLAQLGALFGAALRRIGAARAEAAAAGGIEGTGHVALKHNALGGPGRYGVRHGDGRNQAAGVGVDAVGDELIAVRQLHQLAQVHHADAV